MKGTFLVLEMFLCCTGLSLGAVIIYCTAKILVRDSSAVLLFLINSALGAVVILAFREHLWLKGIYLSIPPIGAVGIGILGLPGAFAAIIMSLI